jgi:hypothetical protein
VEPSRNISDEVAGGPPELDAPLVAAANFAPYLATAVLVQLRHRPWWQRLAGAVVSLFLVAVVAPVGGVLRSREGWLVYLAAFAVLGLLTWVGLGVLWVARQFWIGRWGARLPDEVYGGSMGPAKKHSLPISFAYFAFWIASVPWLWPLGALPYGGVWLWALTAAWLGGFVLMAVLRVSDRPPKVFVPPYLRPPESGSTRTDFLPVLATVVVVFAGVLALTSFLTDDLHVGRTWIKAGIFLLWAAIAAHGARQLRPRRAVPSPSEGSARPPAS